MARTRGLDLIGPAEIESLRRQVKLYIASGKLAKRVNNENDALLIALKGRELGMQPLEALAQIYVVNGVTTCQGQGMLSLILQSGKVLVQYPCLEDEHVTVYMQRRDARGQMLTDFTADWDRARAEKANLWGSTDSWKKYSRTMLKWKAIGEAARTVGPDLIGGMYAVEEFGVQSPDDITPEMVSFTTGRETVGSEVQEQVKARFNEALTPENTEALKSGLATILSQAGVTRVKDLTSEEVAGIDRLIAKYAAQPDPEPPLPSGTQEGDFEPEPDPPAPTQAKRLEVPAETEPAETERLPASINGWRAWASAKGAKGPAVQAGLLNLAFGDGLPAADTEEQMQGLCAITYSYLAGDLALPDLPAGEMPPTGDDLGRSTEAHGTLPLA